jgi:uncharacterized protein (TIGR02145 family)
MKKLYFILTIILLAVTNTLQAQNDSIYFWKSGAMIHRQSIKTVDLDSITFNQTTNPTGLNIAGPNVIDIDGNTYQSIINCAIIFTKQNLNVSKYSDGTTIPQVQDPTQWANLTTGAWCYYNNNSGNGAIYGKLYNWYAVEGIYDAESLANPALRKKLAPNGWHIPSNSEWTQLTDCLGGEAIAGGKMKSTGTIQAGTGFWQDPNISGTNESGFTGLPAGVLNGNGGFFFNIGNAGFWWSSTELSTTNTWTHYLIYNYANAWKNYLDYQNYGFSVRCVRD